MKIVKAIISVVLSLVILMSTTISFAFYGTSSYTGYRYNHNSRYEGITIYNGIDVSKHNGEIDWKKVKNDGIDFAIVRVGYTGYDASRFSLNYDPVYDRNIRGAIDAGLEVGVYWYSQAITTKEAVQEAKKVLNVIDKYKITLPVYFDYEFAGKSSGRLDHAWSSGALNKSKMTAIAEAFCDTITSAGYHAGVYANKSFFTTKLDAGALEQKYSIWLAHYTKSTSYSGQYNLWQYSSDGTVDGISGRVDCNFMYGSFETTVDTVKNITTRNKSTDGTSVTVSWDKASFASGYEIYIYSNSKWEYLDTTKENMYTIPMSPDSTMRIKVRAFSGGNYGYFSKEYTVYSNPGQINNIAVTTPKEGSMKIKWTSSQGEGYVIQYSKYSSFNSGNVIYVKDITQTNYTINNLSKGKYYIRVRTYTTQKNKYVYGKWSNIKNIVVK